MLGGGRDMEKGRKEGNEMDRGDDERWKSYAQRGNKMIKENGQIGC